MIRNISNEINFTAESFALLQHLCTGKTYADLKESLNKKYAHPFQEQDGLKKFEQLELIEAYAQTIFAQDMEEIQYYFTPYQEEGTGCAAKAALLWDEYKLSYQTSLPALRNSLSDLPETTYCRRFGECLQEISCNTLQDDSHLVKTETPIDVISCLMDLDLDESEKWKLQKIFFSPKEHQEKLLLLLTRASGCLEKFQKPLEELAEAFQAYWTKTLEGRSPITYLPSIKIEENPAGFCLSPSILKPNTAAFYIHEPDDGTSKNPDAFRFGILFGEDFALRTARASEEDGYAAYAIQALKLLGDKSKFEILSYLRDKEAYGSELAKRLKLTTATISHHMNTLLEAGLIEVKRIENRLYYSANKDTLGEILDYSKRILLGEDGS
ncbi:winged helix-turn-helix domain-containing protein [Lachnospiraceae bacterium 29-84]